MKDMGIGTLMLLAVFTAVVFFLLKSLAEALSRRRNAKPFPIQGNIQPAPGSPAGTAGSKERDEVIAHELREITEDLREIRSAIGGIKIKIKTGDITGVRPIYKY